MNKNITHSGNIGGRIHLSDLRPISQQEYAIACQVCENIKKIEENREAYVREHNYKLDIVIPDGNWAKDAPTNLYELYQLVLTQKYDVINRLRLFVQPFSGYDLVSFTYGYGKVPVTYPVKENFDQEMDRKLRTPGPEVWKYLEITRRIPEEFIIKRSKILGEVGWDVNGSPVNYDIWLYQEYMNLIYGAGIFDFLRDKAKANGSVNILDIGAGYGGLAYSLKHAIPNSNYYICDIPESLLFSNLYLTITRPEYPCSLYDATDKSILTNRDFGFKFIPNYMFDNLATADLKFDLVINTASFSEMSEKQIRYYADNLTRMLGDTGILFERNSDDRSLGWSYCKLYLSSYFRYRKTILSRTRSYLGRSQFADVWANTKISNILNPQTRTDICTLINQIVSGQRILYWIYRIIGIKRSAVIIKLLNSKLLTDMRKCKIFMRKPDT